MDIPTDHDVRRAKDVLERTTLAVESLCVGAGDVRSRLKYAVEALLPLQEQDFPADLQAKLRKIIQSSTKYDASDLDRKFPIGYGRSHNDKEGKLDSTMRRIRNSTGKKIAEDIWDLYQQLEMIVDYDIDRMLARHM